MTTRCDNASMTAILTVSQSIHRLPRANDSSPCVTPGAKLLMMGNGSRRFLGGFEHLRLQGLNSAMLSTEGKIATHFFSQLDLKSLAGNAFSANHVAVSALVSLSCFDFPTSISSLDHLRREVIYKSKHTRMQPPTLRPSGKPHVTQ